MQIHYLFFRLFAKQLILLLTVTLFILLIGFWEFNYQKESVLQQNKSDLASIAILKANRVENWLQNTRLDAIVLSENFSKILKKELRIDTTNDIDKQKTLEHLLSIQKRNKYTSVAMFDLKTKIYLSTNNESTQQLDKYFRQHAMKVIRTRQSVLDDMYVGLQQTPEMNMFTPLLLDNDGVSQITGVLHLRIDPAQTLFPIFESWPVNSISAEVLLVRKNGTGAFLLNKVRHEEKLPIAMHIPFDRKNIPTLLAVQGKSGFFRGVDYNNVPVVSYITQFPSMQWSMVSKIDEAEVYALIYKRTRYFAMVGALLFFAMIVIMWLYARLSLRFVETQVQAEYQLKKNENTLRLLISNIRDYAIITLDAYGCVTSWNKGAEYITGYAIGDIFGQYFACFYPPEDITSGQPKRDLQLAMSTGRSETEGSRIRKDGKRYWANTVITAIHNANEELIGYTNVTRDVSVKRQAEKLHSESEALRYASQMKSEFLASMSHELRTPLNAIIGFSEVIKDGIVGDITEQQRKYVSNIFDSGQHLLSLINDVLDLSKIEAGKMELELETFSPSIQLPECLSMVKEKALLNNVKLKHDIVSNLGSFQGDGRKLKQIVYNLLSNAVKFTSDGGDVTLSARHVLREKAIVASTSRLWKTREIISADKEMINFNKFLEIAVHDTGIGISATNLDKLFQPFIQIDSGLAREYEGTGLGLVLVRELVQLHGGVIEVSSAEGQGSCFKVWIPWRYTSIEPERSSNVESPVIKERVAGVSSTENICLPLALVIENDHDYSELIRFSLEKEGFRVLHVHSAEEAIKLLEELIPALITINIDLPEMNGWDFLANRQEIPIVKQIPLVIISVDANQIKGWAFGAVLVLDKPVAPSVLRATIADLMKDKLTDKKRLSVLVVDSDPLAVKLISTVLSDMGVLPLITYSGEEAIEIVRTQEPDAIVLDLLMPDVTGFDVVDTLHNETQNIPIIILTAKEVTNQDRALLNGHIFRIIEKSNFNNKIFRTEIQRALSTYIEEK